RAWIAEGRVGRARRMVERLRQLGAPVELERVKELAGGGAIGRPHVARAMVEAGVVTDIDAAFGADWIGTGGRAYVAKDAVTPVEAVELIHGAGGVAVLAPPSVHAGASAVPEPVIRAMAAAGLDGLEVDHPDQPPADRVRWRALAAELGLETTGASDCHGALYGYPPGTARPPPPPPERPLGPAPRLPRRPLRLPPGHRAPPRRRRGAPAGPRPRRLGGQSATTRAWGAACFM